MLEGNLFISICQNSNYEAFGMKFEGRHHSGLEDAKNIARLALNMLLLGISPLL